VIERLVETARRPGHQPRIHLNTRLAQQSNSAARMSWVGISGRDDHTIQLGSNDRVTTGWCPARCAARFQCDVKGRSTGLVTVPHRVAKRLHFGVRLAGTSVPPAPNDSPASNQDSTHAWIGRSKAPALPGKLHRLRHVGVIDFVPVVQSFSQQNDGFVQLCR
jgi:hypothetical protein